MIGKQELDGVLFLISWWLSAINSHNAIGFFDINKIAEDLALKLLNEIYGLQLENLKYEKENYPGIDLGDKINKIGFQITSRRDARKIRESLEKFVQGPNEIYTSGIRFLILNQGKKPQLSKEKYQEIYPNFNPKHHILTATELIQKVRQIYESDKDKFYRIKGILEEEISGKAFKKENLGIGKIEPEKGEPLEQKVGDIFRLMGFEVEYNRRIAGNEINILIKKKKRFGPKYEGYICECKNRNEKVTEQEVLDYSMRQEVIIKYFRKKNIEIDFDVMLVSGVGFTDNARQTADSLGVILKTYTEILSELMDFDAYLTGLICDFEGSQLKRLYIQPDFFSERQQEVINCFKFVEEWLQQPDRKQFSLLGGHGTGKTSFAKILAYKMAKVYKKGSGKNRIPFLVDLRECKKAFSLKSLLQQHLETAEVKPANADKFLKLLAEGHIMLILDAFDEMATIGSREISLSNFKQLNEAVMGNAKVILTSRTQYFRDKNEVERILKQQGINDISDNASMLLQEISGKPEYEIAHLKEFSDTQVQKYLQKAIGDEWETAYEKIESIYNFYDLSCRPMLLDMIVKTLPKIEKEEKEFNAVNLYEAYTQLWFQREDQRIQITKEGKEELMEAVAYKLWKEGKLCIHYSALSDIIREHLKEKIKTTGDLEAANYEVRTASFLVRDEDGNYSFAHGSFQEFFIAQKIKKELLNENFDILDLKLLSKEIVFFFRQLMENDSFTLQLLIKVLVAEHRNRIAENTLYIFYTLLKMSFLKQQFSLKEDREFSSKDVVAFKEMIQSHLPTKFGLRGTMLSGWTIPYMVFKKVNFAKAKMEDSNFNGTTFEDVVFNKTQMKGTDFNGSKFKNVCFERIEAHHCNFKNCRFVNCIVKNSDFNMSNFMNAAFESCTIGGNDFTGAGFYDSDFNMKIHKNNCYLGAGVPVTKTSNLSPVFVDQGHEDIIRTVTISRDGRFLVSGGDDKTIKLWDLESGHLIKTIKGHDGAVLSVFISTDNRWIVSGSSDHTVKLWDSESGHLITSIKKHKDWVNSVFISPDNQRIVSGSSDHTVKVWNLENCRLIKTLKGHEQAVLSIFISPDNQRVVSGGGDKKVKLWDLESGYLINTLEAHEHAVLSVCVSPDNRWIVSSSDDKTVKLWELESGHLIKTLNGHKDWVRSVFISSDNRWIVSGSDDKVVKLWNLESGHLIKTFEGHENIVNSVLIRQDNRLIVSGSFDETIKVWDIKSGRLIRTLEGHKYPVHSDIADPKNLHRIYYRDRLALYPAKDLPMMRLEYLQRSSDK